MTKISIAKILNGDLLVFVSVDWILGHWNLFGIWDLVIGDF